MTCHVSPRRAPLSGFAAVFAALLSVLIAALPALAEPAATQPAAKVEPSRSRNIAIFIKNRAGDALESKVGALEELVASRLAGRFSDKGLKLGVVSREDAANAVASFAKEGANKGDAKLPGSDIDAILSNNTSALRLAQALNADYLLVVSIATYGKSTKTLDAYGVKTTVVEEKMRLTYKMLDKGVGAAFDGETIDAAAGTRSDKNASSNEDGMNELLNDASQKLVEKIAGRIDRVPGVAPDPSNVNVTIVCSVQDLVVPDVVRNDKGEYLISASQYRIEAMDVTVELNGTVIGSAPGAFSMPKGLGKLRLSREGCKDWERTINAVDGMKLNVSLTMSDKGFARWKETIATLQGMKADAKLTDAQVEAVKGFAQMLRQSGYKVDIRNDTKVDTNLSGLTFQSIFK